MIMAFCPFIITLIVILCARAAAGGRLQDIVDTFDQRHECLSYSVVEYNRTDPGPHIRRLEIQKEKTEECRQGKWTLTMLKPAGHIQKRESCPAAVIGGIIGFFNPLLPIIGGVIGGYIGQEIGGCNGGHILKRESCQAAVIGGIVGFFVLPIIGAAPGAFIGELIGGCNVDHVQKRQSCPGAVVGGIIGFLIVPFFGIAPGAIIGGELSGCGKAHISKRTPCPAEIIGAIIGFFVGAGVGAVPGAQIGAHVGNCYGGGHIQKRARECPEAAIASLIGFFLLPGIGAVPGTYIGIHLGGCSAEGHIQKRAKECPAANLGALIGFFLIPGFGAIPGAYLGAHLGGCMAEDKKQPTPPVFESCPSSISEYLPKGEVEMEISWPAPRATDPDGDVKSVRLIKGQHPGSKFKVGTNELISYEATDNDGLSNTCYFSVKINAYICDAPGWISNQGSPIECDTKDNKTYVWGTTCNYTCAEGYELAEGDGSKICLKNETWWPSDVQCNIIHCPEPVAPEKVKYVCTSPDYEYSSSCTPRCTEPGFQVIDATPIRCNASKQWQGNVSQVCIDIAAPQIVKCNVNNVYYAESHALGAVAQWEIPAFKDNSDTHLDVIQSAGPPSGTRFDVGRTLVKYKAIDDAGNESNNCTMLIDVVVSDCGHPIHTINNDYLKYNCTDDYYFGSTCNVTCAFNLPLKGSTNITCNRNDTTSPPPTFWEWEGEMPWCEIVECPKLDEPRNGALACTTVNLRPFCTMFCNEKYDIPFKFDGKFFCPDNGIWQPRNDTPDCTVKIRASGRTTVMNLPAELYYSGNCSDNETMMSIKNTFVGIAQTEMDTYKFEICGNHSVCTVDDVTVTCGQTTRRKRSSRTDGALNMNTDRERRATSDVIIVRFNLALSFEPTGEGIHTDYAVHDEIQAAMVGVINNALSDGKLDVQGAQLLDDTVQTTGHGIVECLGEGRIFDGESCRSCSSGTFYDPETDDCEPCLVGTYQDGDGVLTCKPCGEGYSTETEGSRSPDDCRAYCTTGTSSPTGLVPCDPCKPGTYQNETGQTICSACPKGTTTSAPASSSKLDCKAFDVLIKNTMDETPIGPNVVYASNLTIAFWIQLLTNRSVLEIHASYSTLFGAAIGTATGETYTGEYLELSVSSSSVNVGYRGSTASVDLVDTKVWTHIAVSVNIDLEVLSILKNGQVVHQFPVDVVPDLATSSVATLYTYFRIASAGVGDILVSGFSVTGSVEKSDLADLFESCFNVPPSSFLTMSDFLDLDDKNVRITTTSTCDAIDECESQPCGAGHVCINKLEDYECVCSNGYSGRTCDVPPDFCVNNECANGAACTNKENGYICVCTNGYTGDLCEIPPAEGIWGEWTVWGECSKTCEGGNRTRLRICAVPGRDENGEKDCVGINMEMQECNDIVCPECRALERRYGTLLTCWEEDNLKFCNLTCVNPDETFPPGTNPLQLYKCGYVTDYKWSHTTENNPNGTLPICAVLHAPRSYGTRSRVEYQAFPCIESQYAIAEVNNRIRSRVQCVIDEDCAMNVVVSGCSASFREKRSTEAVITVSLKVDLNLSKPLNLGDFLRYNKTSDGIMDIVNALLNLELAAQEMQNNTEAIFSLDVNNVSYNVNSSSLSVSVEIICEDGAVFADGLCVDCPKGTRQMDGDYCEYCQKGTYQNMSKQVNCIACPEKHTTLRAGAESESECVYVPETTTSVTEESDTVPPEEEENIGLIIGLVVAGVLLLVIVVVLTVVMIKRASKRQEEHIHPEGGKTKYWHKSPDWSNQH